MRLVTLDEIAQGEHLARAATPGPWGVDPNHGTLVTAQIAGTDLTGVVAVPGMQPLAANAAYLAHHSPDRLLSLYAEVRRLKAALEWIEKNALSPVWIGGAKGRWIPGDGSGGSGGIALVARALSEVRE